MKVRSDFVTNSSSSSYIIAKHKDIRQQDIEKFIDDNIKQFASIVEQNNEWYKENTTLDEAKKEVVDRIMSMDSDMEIDNWKISGGEASNESGNIIDMFLYETGFYENKHFKKVCCW